MTPEKANGGQGGNKSANGGKKQQLTRQLSGWESQESLDKFVNTMKNSMTMAQWKQHGDKITEYATNGTFGNLDNYLDKVGASHHVHKQVRLAQEGRSGFNPNMGYKVINRGADGSVVESHIATPKEVKLIQKAQKTYGERLKAWEKGGQKGPKPKPPVQGRIRNNQF